MDEHLVKSMFVKYLELIWLLVDSWIGNTVRGKCAFLIWVFFARALFSMNKSSVTVQDMAIWVVEFWRVGYTRFNKFVAKNQHTQRKILYFVNWWSVGLSKSAAIWLSKFQCQKSSEYLWFRFFLFQNNNIGAHFCMHNFW
jgi:hypothetical protein